MSNKLEKATRNPSLAHAKRRGFVESDADLYAISSPTGVHKRMHFGHGAATGWPDDLFVFTDGHHWWVEFKGDGKEATPLQTHIHDNIKYLRGDCSVIDTPEQFVAEFEKRLREHYDVA